VGRVAALAALCFSLLFAACAAPWASAGGVKVQVSMREYTISPDKTQVRPGNVTFDAHNAGSMTHEMVVLRTDLPALSIPTAPDGTADEEASGVKNVGEVSDVSPGESKSVTVNLAPGRYLLVCNLPGHLRQGMWAELRVTS
jgi:uncharacterized cupredoxin-like copper-binding protein